MITIIVSMPLLRFSHVVRGQFYGHSHMDEFRIHYGPGPDGSGRKRPVGVQYITPNNGPYHNLNPSYRVYYIDGDHPHTTRVRLLLFLTYMIIRLNFSDKFVVV